MGMYDALDEAVLAFTKGVYPGEVSTDDLLRPVHNARLHLNAALELARLVNSREAKMRLTMDVRMEAEAFVNALKAAKDGIAFAHKTASERLAKLEAEMVPFAAEQNIAGSTHVAIYKEGADRVVVKDYELARKNSPDHFWRVKEDEPDKRAFAKAMRDGHRYKGVGWDEGPPSLRIEPLDAINEGKNDE